MFNTRKERETFNMKTAIKVIIVIADKYKHK